MASTRTPAQLAEWDQAEAQFREKLDTMVAEARTRLAVVPRDQFGSELIRQLGGRAHAKVLAAMLAVAVLRLADTPPAPVDGCEADA